MNLKAHVRMDDRYNNNSFDLNTSNYNSQFCKFIVKILYSSFSLPTNLVKIEADGNCKN